MMIENNNDNKEYIVIFSLGQLFNTKVEDIPNAFATSLSKGNGFLNIVATAYSYLIYGCETVLLETITKRINVGNATWQELFDYIKEWSFNNNLTEKEALEIWNKGSGVNEESIGNARSLIEFLNNNQNIIAIVLSNTNTVHWDYIMNSLNNIEGFQNLIDNGQIIFSLSFKHQASNLIELTNIALDNVYKGNNTIISLHRNVRGVGEDMLASYNVRENGNISDYILKVIKDYEEGVQYYGLTSSIVV